MTKPTYTSQELISLLSLCDRSTITRRAKREGWQSQKRAGRGGGNLWLLSSMPPATRKSIEIAEKEAEYTTLSVVLAPNIEEIKQAYLQKNENIALTMPDKALEIAKARFRIVTEWEKHLLSLKEETKPDTVHVGKTMEVFVQAYNTGTYLPEKVREFVPQITAKTLYRWVKELKESGHDLACLAPKYGKWAKRETCQQGNIGEEAEKVFLKAYLHQNKPSVRLAYQVMCLVLKTQELPFPSYQSTRRFFHRYDSYFHDVVLFMRDGEKARNDFAASYITRDDSLLWIGEILVADGHVMNFMVKNPETGKPCRATLIAWQDWKSRMILGFEVKITENTQAIASSLFQAIRTLGKMPTTVYLDNGKAFKNKYFNDNTDMEEFDGLYIRLGIQVVHAPPYKAQGKIIERWWKDFDQQCAVLMDSYVGNNIDNKPARLRRNETWHQKQSSDYMPILEDVKILVSSFIEYKGCQEHPTIKGKSCIEVFNEGKGAGFTLDETMNLARQFMYRKTVKPQRCRITMFGITYESDVLYGINKELTAYYSWADLSKIYIFDAEQCLCEALPVQSVVPIAEKDSLSMDLVKTKMKEQTKQRAETRKIANQIGGAASEVLLELPYMQGIAKRKADYILQSQTSSTDYFTEEIPKQAISAEDRLAIEQIQTVKPQENTYTAPLYFASEYERYEYLFNLQYVEKIILSQEDIVFSSEYETSSEYKKSTGKRFEQLKNFYQQAI